MTLNNLRKQIDRIDEQLLRLLNRRAVFALHVGELKRRQDRPVFDRKREAEILNRLKSANQGPLSAGDLEEIFRTIVRSTRWLQISSDKKIESR